MLFNRGLQLIKIKKLKGGEILKNKALVCYWSQTGNTEKVAKTIRETLNQNDIEVAYKRVKEMEDDDFLDYDLVFMGVPSHHFLPPKPVLKTLRKKLNYYSNNGHVKLCAPKVPGKKAVVFCTYSGPHTGIKEAIPVGLYLQQFFEHIGFEVLDEWYVVGELNVDVPGGNTEGELGDIRGRPNEEDLDEIGNKVVDVIDEIG